MTTHPPLTLRWAATAPSLIFALTLTLMLSATPVRAGFVVQDLGTLSAGLNSGSTAINASGSIAGIGAVPGLRSSGFVGQGSSLTPLGSPVRLGSSEAFGISSSGAVVGIADFPAPGSIPMIQGHAFKSLGGLVLDLKTASAADTYSIATGINAGGTMVGASGLDPSHFQAMRINGPQSFTALGGLGGARSMATAIGDNGTIVGWAENAAGNSHAVIFGGAHGVTDLGTINNALTSAATGVNTHGDVIGYSGGPDSAASFIKRGDAPLVPLGALPFSTSTIAAGINVADIVVGQASFGTGSTGFIWDPATGRMYDLNTLTAGGYQIVGAAGINGSDQVAATILVDGVEHAAILRPDSSGQIFTTPGAVPEPGSWLLLAVGAAGLGAASRLRRGRTAGPGAGGPAVASPGC